MKQKQATELNYLDFIPERSEHIEWRSLDDDTVQLTLKRTGFFNRVSQKVFGAPQYSYIDLDRLGSFVWQHIDGEKTVHKIGQSVESEFGDSAAPVYERLAEFMKMLQNNNFIEIKNKT
jgi:hypothetical protein